MTVVVIGNCSFDRFFRVSHFPQPAETLLAADCMVDIGGKGANQALAAARCGAKVMFLAAVGRDNEGAAMVRRLRANKVATSNLVRRKVASDQSIIYVTPDGANMIVSVHAASASIQPIDTARILSRLSPGDIVLVQGNLSLTTTTHCLRAARSAGAQTIVNPAPIQYGYDTLWPLTDFAILNEVEIAVLTGSKDPLQGARRLRKAGVANVIATLGANGAITMFGDSVAEFRAPKVNAVDTTGAGDVFCGVFSAGLAKGRTPKDAARIAVAAASLSVTQPGSQCSFPSRAELHRLFITIDAVHKQHGKVPFSASKPGR